MKGARSYDSGNQSFSSDPKKYPCLMSDITKIGILMIDVIYEKISNTYYFHIVKQCSKRICSIFHKRNDIFTTFDNF